MNYYLEHRNLFQGVCAWAMIFAACTAETKYWWIIFFVISISTGSIELYINKQQGKTVKTSDDTTIAESEKNNVGDKLI